jgi:parallel beta-helix repeat protein
MQFLVNFLGRSGLFLSLSLLVFSPLGAGSAEIYVSPEGTSWATGTSGDPHGTISAAMLAAGPGQVIVVQAGTYNESLIIQPWHNSGFTIRAAVGHSVTVNSPDGVGFYAYSASDVWIEDINFSGGRFNIESSDGITFNNVTIAGATGDFAMRIDGSDRVTLNNVWLNNNRTPLGIAISGHCDRILIQESLFTNNHGPEGSVTQATIQIANQTPVHSIQVLNNNFLLSGDKSTRPVIPPGGGLAAIQIFASNGSDFTDPKIIIRNNRISNYRMRGTNDDTWYDPSYLKTPEQGGERSNGFSIIDSHHILIADNEVFDSSGYGINAFRSTYLSIVGNHFKNLGKNGVFLVGDSATGTGGAPNMISDNRIEDCGWLKGGTSGISSIFSGPGNVITRNFISGQVNGIAGTVGANWYGDGNGILADLDSGGTIIVGNIVINNQGAGISMNRSSDCVVLHNTVIGNGSCPHRDDNSGIFIAGNFGPSDRQQIANNIVYNSRKSPVWVFGTGLNHTIRHNVLASGPLTLSGFSPSVVDWFGTFFNSSTWASNAPGISSGVGHRGDRPTFLGDFTGTDPTMDTLHWLPVNGSAGTADAWAYSNFSFPTLPPEFDTNQILSLAISSNFSRFVRPSTGSNRGAIEPPPTPAIAGTNGAFFQLVASGAIPYRVKALHLGTWMELREGKPYSREFGFVEAAPFGDGWSDSSRMGFTWHGLTLGATEGWVFSTRFGWINSQQSGQEFFIWLNNLQTWISVQEDGAFFSFDFGPMTPVPGDMSRYNTRIGMVTVSDSAPAGWLISDRFGFVWFARDGTGVWFFSASRDEWIGITPGGGLFSTKENRFLD